MPGLQTYPLTCPYCGELCKVLIDCSADQSYVEDCQVCCKPIFFVITLDAQGHPDIVFKREDE